MCIQLQERGDGSHKPKHNVKRAGHNETRVGARCRGGFESKRSKPTFQQLPVLYRYWSIRGHILHFCKDTVTRGCEEEERDKEGDDGE